MMIQQRHANKIYERELLELHGSLASMAKHVGELLSTAVKAFDSPGRDFWLEAKAIDQKINELNFRVEELVTEIITKHDVFADELRLILSSIKISTYFERMGDFAKNIIKRIYKIEGNVPPEVGELLKSMVKTNQELLASLIQVIEVIDESETQKVWEGDDVLDEKYSTAFKIIQAEMMKKPELIKPYTHLLLISRNLERIGDYTASIAKIMYYIKSGKAVTKELAKLMASEKDDIVS